MYVKVIARQSSDIFWDTVYNNTVSQKSSHLLTVCNFVKS